MSSDVKKVFLLFIGLFILIIFVALGKGFGMNLRDFFLAPKVAERLSPLEKKTYKVVVTEDGVLKSIWTQKPPFWRLEVPAESKTVIFKNEAKKLYITDTKYNSIQVQDNANLEQYLALSPLGIIKTYQTGSWQSTSATHWEATLKDSSKIKADFDAANGLLTKLVITKSNNQVYKTYDFQYSNIDNVQDGLFEAFAQNTITPTPTVTNNTNSTNNKESTTTIPKTGANENILFGLVVAGFIGFFLKKSLA